MTYLLVFLVSALGFLSSALAITITAPSSGTVWDFSTAKTIKFTSDSTDPSYISIILRNEDGSFQTKLADNVKTSTGEYTTQPDPSIPNGDDYEIQIIDSAGQLALSDVFTVELGASGSGTTSSSSATSSATTTSTSVSSTFTSLTSTLTSATSTLTSPASSASTSFTTPLSSSGMIQLRTIDKDIILIQLFIVTGSTSTSFSSTSSNSASETTSSTSSDASSTGASASASQSNSAASFQLDTPKGFIALLGAIFAMFYV
ncbi:hypothetical protein N7528_001349 [Penicillium herquei]|nr:hypothetical protein N7528_001349 [Penicillium herquei]